MRTLTGPAVTRPAKLRRCVDFWVEKLALSAVSNDGAGNCMFESLGRGTFSAHSLSVCEKVSPSACGLCESNLQRIEETVSVKCLRVERDLMPSRYLSVERTSGAPWLLDQRSHVVKVEFCCGPSRA